MRVRMSRRGRCRAMDISGTIPDPPATSRTGAGSVSSQTK